MEDRECEGRLVGSEGKGFPLEVAHMQARLNAVVMTAFSVTSELQVGFLCLTQMSCSEESSSGCLEKEGR